MNTINIRANITSSQVVARNLPPEPISRPLPQSTNFDKSTPKQRNTHGGEFLLNNLRFDSSAINNLSSSKDRNPPQNIVKQRGSVNPNSNISQLFSGKMAFKPEQPRQLESSLDQTREPSGSLLNGNSLNLALLGKPKPKFESRREIINLNIDSKPSPINTGPLLTSSNANPFPISSFNNTHEFSKISSNTKSAIDNKESFTNTPTNAHKSDVKRTSFLNNSSQVRVSKLNSELAIARDSVCKDSSLIGLLIRDEVAPRERKDNKRGH